jgi:hypothetical protein
LHEPSAQRGVGLDRLDSARLVGRDAVVDLVELLPGLAIELDPPW